MKKVFKRLKIPTVLVYIFIYVLGFCFFLDVVFFFCLSAYLSVTTESFYLFI